VRPWGESPSLRLSAQVQQAVKKANGVLVFIARGLGVEGIRDVSLQLYRGLGEATPGSIVCVRQVLGSPYLGGRDVPFAIEGVSYSAGLQG